MATYRIRKSDIICIETVPAGGQTPLTLNIYVHGMPTPVTLTALAAKRAGAELVALMVYKGCPWLIVDVARGACGQEC